MSWEFPKPDTLNILDIIVKQLTENIETIWNEYGMLIKLEVRNFIMTYLLAITNCSDFNISSTPMFHSVVIQTNRCITLQVETRTKCISPFPPFNLIQWRRKKLYKTLFALQQPFSNTPHYNLLGDKKAFLHTLWLTWFYDRYKV